MKTESINKLESLKTIWNVFFAIATIGFAIYGIIAAVQAPKDSTGMAVLLLLVGLAILIVGWAITNLIFDCLICWRKENVEYMDAHIDYMNTRLAHKKTKSANKEEAK